MRDKFSHLVTKMDHPGNEHYIITPANENLVRRPRALWILTAGDVVLQDKAGTVITYPAVPAHTLIVFRPTQVRVGTTATLAGWD
jgi:hypothetical protein